MSDDLAAIYSGIPEPPNDEGVPIGAFVSVYNGALAMERTRLREKILSLIARYPHGDGREVLELLLKEVQ